MPDPGKDFDPSGEWKAAFWRDWVEGEVPWRRYLASRQVELALRFLEPKAPMLVLDAGCGYGRLVHQLLARVPGLSAVGVDASESMLQEARSRLKGRFVGARAVLESLPFPNHAFDAVICIGVIMHVRDDAASLRELGRVLKPGGTLVLSFNSLLSPFSVLGLLNNRLVRRRDSTFVARTPRHYIRRLKESGLRVTRSAAATVICVEPTLPPLRRLGLRLMPQWLLSFLAPIDRLLSEGAFRWFGHEVLLLCRHDRT